MSSIKVGKAYWAVFTQRWVAPLETTKYETNRWRCLPLNHRDSDLDGLISLIHGTNLLRPRDLTPEENALVMRYLMTGETE